MVLKYGVCFNIVVQHNYPANYRYGINLQVHCKLSHVVLFIRLAGDVATNPGPSFSPPYKATFSTPPRPRDGSNPRTIECLYLNARSLNNKTNELQTLVTDVDLVAITETWLKPEIGNCEVLPGNDFTIHRKDRVDRIGGGTLLAVRNSLFCFR